jgi:formate-dependent nitrite reductase membrane component NrfD
VLDLKRVTVDPLVILNAFRRFPGSILSVGTWIIAAFTLVSIATAVLWFYEGWSLARKTAEVIGAVLGVSTSAYTGLLLAFARGRPFWGNPYLPWVFVISGTLTGLAMALLLIPIVAKLMPRFSQDFKTLFDDKTRLARILSDCQRYIIVLIGIELALVLVELFTGLPHTRILLTGTNLSLVFYAYVILGLIAPLGIGYYTSKLESSGRNIWMTSFFMGGYVLILFGGFLLRYVVLIGGQMIF